MKIVSIKPFVKYGFPCYLLTFDNGVSGAVTDAKFRGKVKYIGASLFTAVTLFHGDDHGMATMPVDWNPKIGDDVPMPPHWKT